MVVTEDKRHRLYGKLEQTLGSEEAETMMQLLPPTGWDDVARQSDLLVLKSDIVDALDVKIDALDRKVDSVDERLSGRIDALDERLSGRIDALDGRVRDLTIEMRAGFAAMQLEMHKELRSFFFTSVAMNLSFVGLLFTGLAVFR